MRLSSEKARPAARCAFMPGLLALLAFTPIAGADVPDAIEAGASQNYFYVEPSYNGTNIVLFGSIDRERLNGHKFDVAITIRGPVKPMTIWKKDRRAGLWVNSESLTFEDVPTYYALLSTRPASEIASIEQRKSHELGPDVLNLEPKDSPKLEAQSLDEFRDALIRLRKRAGLFVENGDSAIEFFGTRLFRSSVFLPPAAGAGLYRAKFYLLQDGKVIGEAASQIRLNKIGIEARLSFAALNYPWLYGAMAVLLAAAIGGGASVIFRRV